MEFFMSSKMHFSVLCAKTVSGWKIRFPVLCADKMAFSIVNNNVVYWQTLHGLPALMLPNFPSHIIDNIHEISGYST
jgi:hypothetical protein